MQNFKIGPLLLVLALGLVVGSCAYPYIAQAQSQNTTGLVVITSPNQALKQLGLTQNWKEFKDSRQSQTTRNEFVRRAAGDGEQKDKIFSWRVNWNNYYSPMFTGLSTNWWVQSTVAKEGEFQYTIGDQNGVNSFSFRLPAREEGAYIAGNPPVSTKPWLMQVGIGNGTPFAGSTYSEICPIGPSLHFVYEEDPQARVWGRVHIDNHSIYQRWYVESISINEGQPYFSRQALEIEDDNLFWGHAGIVVVATDRNMDNICSLSWWQDMNRR